MAESLSNGRSWSRLCVATLVVVLSGLAPACTAIVQFDPPPPDKCGNGVVDPWEDCEGTDVGPNSCESQGAGAGTLACTTHCDFDFSGCTGNCGNETVEGVEQCDGPDLAGQNCQSQGFEGGTLRCHGDCTFNVFECFGLPNCGDDFCDLDGHETPQNCSQDCDSECQNPGQPVCEIGRGENIENCPQDCAWAEVSAGEDHTCGRRLDGSVWCWGANEHGQLGDGSYQDAELPVHVGVNGERLVHISAGGNHTCVAAESGVAYCWGLNSHGQLGRWDVTAENSPIPVPVDGVNYLDHISAGSNFTCGVRNDKVAYCWGRHDHGQLGAGFPSGPDTGWAGEPCSRRPIIVSSTAALEWITVSGYGEPSQTHGCAWSGMAVWCWGSSDHGQTGHFPDTDDATPVLVADFGPVNDVSAGFGTTCAAHEDGIYCWGSNGGGLLGIGQTTLDNTNVPQLASGDLSGVDKVTAGMGHMCALRYDDSVVWCWGSNHAGQLGDGTTETRFQPTEIQPPVDASFKTIAAGRDHTCALMQNDHIWCWGRNDLGQLGDGTQDQRTEPVEVQDPDCCYVSN